MAGNRAKGPDLFETELDAALEHIMTDPHVGTVYEQGNLDATARRTLMPKTKTHVYWAVEDDAIVVVSIWGARKRRGPKL